MSRLLKLTLLAPTLAFAVACDQSPAALDETTAPAGPEFAVLQNDKSLVPFSVFVPCAAGGAGEVVNSTVRLHTVVSRTLNAAGGEHFMYHLQPMGASGVGATTGDVYRGTGVTREGFTVGSDGLPFEDTFVDNFNWIGPGPGNKSKLHETFHVTVNANGTTTVEFDDVVASCEPILLPAS